MLYSMRLILFTCFLGFFFKPELSNRPAIHGMLLMGKTQIYASHLPLFHAPHDYQVILELHIDASSTEVYKESLKNFPKKTVYTLEPERFELPLMLHNPVAFKANIYRGHFERGADEIVHDAIVHIIKVLYFKQLDGRISQPLDYNALLFGNVSELFLAHLITSAPDFDQISSIKLKDLEIQKRLSALAVLPILLPETTNKKPISGTKLEAKTIGGFPFKILSVKSLYTEFGDLKEM